MMSSVERTDLDFKISEALLILVRVFHNQLLLELSLDPFNSLHIYYRLLKMCLKKFNEKKNAFNRIVEFCI